MAAVGSPEELGTLLGVWAHPDDETYLSAGLMAAAARSGCRVVCVTATRGEAGSQDEARWPLESLALVREAELEAAFEILGVKEHEWLGYPDGGCHLVPEHEGAERLEKIIAEVRPDSVLTFGPDGMTGHPDHKAVNAWTTSAFESSASAAAHLYYATVTPEWAEEMFVVAEPYNVFFDGYPSITPRHELAIDFTVPPDLLEVKWRAIVEQTSQSEALIKAIGKEILQRFNDVETFAHAFSD